MRVLMGADGCCFFLLLFFAVVLDHELFGSAIAAAENQRYDDTGYM